MSIEVLFSRISPEAEKFAYHFEFYMIDGGITSNLEKAHFIAQVMHESAGLTVLKENLNYSAKALLSTFKKYFTPETAAYYARKPMQIGNKVYANRMGNGPESSGDGYKYRGHGPIQLTGKNNIRAYSRYAYGDDTVVNDPSLLTQPKDAARSAVWFWTTNNCGRYAREDNVIAVSAIINTGRPDTKPQGINGLEDRIEWLHRIKRLQRNLVLT